LLLSSFSKGRGCIRDMLRMCFYLDGACQFESLLPLRMLDSLEPLAVLVYCPLGGFDTMPQWILPFCCLYAQASVDTIVAFDIFRGLLAISLSVEFICCCSRILMFRWYFEEFRFVSEYIFTFFRCSFNLERETFKWRIPQLSEKPGVTLCIFETEHWQ